MYLTIGLFFVLSLIELIAAIAVFRVRDLLHTIVLITVLFIFTSLLYLQLSQPILAVLQILVMVGGISTYLFVGTASQSFSNFKHTNMLILAIGSIALFATLVYPILSNYSAYSSTGTNAFSIGSQSQFIGTDTILLYLIAVLLFVVGIGAIVLYRKMSEGKWH